MSRDLLAVKLNSIETLIGAETTPPLQVVDKLGWHLDNIKDAIEAGGTGGVQKDYVDTELAKKVDKVTETSANPRVYGVAEDGTQTTYFATQTPNANTVPLRDASGRFQVAAGVAPLQSVNKQQLDQAVEECAKLSEQNEFTGLNTFTEAAQFDRGLNADADIAITNATVKILNNTANGDGTQKDYIAQYDADKIQLEEDGTEYTLTFPKKSGTLATLSDITGSEIPFKYSELKTEDTLGVKEDGWRLTDDDAHISIYHQNTTTQTGLTVSKSHVGIQATEEEGVGSNAAVFAMSSDTLSMYVMDADGTTSTNLTLQKDSAKLNDVVIATATDLAGKVNILPESAVNQVYAKTANGNEGLSYTYSAEGGTIAIRSASGTLAVETPTQDNDAANKKFVETSCANIPVGVQISDVAGSTSGLVADDDFETLQANANNYILKDGKKFERSSERTTLDSLSYVCNGYLNNRQFQEVIEITVSAKSWVLNSDQLLTDKTIANGKVGGVSIKADFSDGLQIAQSDGNLSVYGALDADIAGRNSNRPITPKNLNKAVLAALTDSGKIMPTDDQQSEFKAAWGITASMFEGGIEIVDLASISVNATSDATSGTIKDSEWSTITDDKIICLELNNEYYFTSDNEHTTGVKSFTHVGWNGNANQTKSINITLETKGWTLQVGYSKYYRHYIKATLADSKVIYYDFSSVQATPYTLATLPVQPDDSHSQFTMVSGSYYSTVNGQVYRSSEGVAKIILNGIYTTDGATMSYLNLTGTEISEITDNVI